MRVSLVGSAGGGRVNVGCIFDDEGLFDNDPAWPTREARQLLASFQRSSGTGTSSRFAALTAREYIQYAFIGWLSFKNTSAKMINNPEVFKYSSGSRRDRGSLSRSAQTLYTMRWSQTDKRLMAVCFETMGLMAHFARCRWLKAQSPRCLAIKPFSRFSRSSGGHAESASSDLRLFVVVVVSESREYDGIYRQILYTPGSEQISKSWVTVSHFAEVSKSALLGPRSQSSSSLLRARS